MKKIVLFGNILLVTLIHAQSDSGVPNRSLFDIVNYDVKKPNNDKSIDGSPYLSNQFFLSKISNVTNTTETRYNAYTDEIEFKSAGTIYIIPKDPSYSTISQQNGSLYTLIDNGYYNDLYTNKNTRFLLKQKISISQNDSTVKNGYNTSPDTPSYVKDKEKYFIYYKGKAYEISKNIKALISEINDPKLNDFINNNKISIKDINSMKKLVDFMASLQ